MSYDVSVVPRETYDHLNRRKRAGYPPECPNPCYRCRAGVDIGDITSNVGPMFSKALGHQFGHLDGLSCSAALPNLQAAVEAMRAHPGTYRQMNPANGWGNYEVALAFLESLREACRQLPSHWIRVT